MIIFRCFKYIYNVIRALIIGIKDILVVLYIAFVVLLYFVFMLSAIACFCLLKPFALNNWLKKTHRKWGGDY